jgi:hypothetical protein
MRAADIEAKAAELLNPSEPEAYLADHPPEQVSIPGNPPGRTHTFPTVSGVRASFAPEGLGQRLFKLLRAEIQTGDEAFDRAVYVVTSTPELTTELLKSPEVRAAIGDVIALGGDIRISSVSVAITSWGVAEGRVLPDGPLAQLLAHIEAPGG